MTKQGFWVKCNWVFAINYITWKHLLDTLVIMPHNPFSASVSVRLCDSVCPATWGTILWSLLMWGVWEVCYAYSFSNLSWLIVFPTHISLILHPYNYIIEWSDLNVDEVVDFKCLGCRRQVLGNARIRLIFLGTRVPRFATFRGHLPANVSLLSLLTHIFMLYYPLQVCIEGIKHHNIWKYVFHLATSGLYYVIHIACSWCKDDACNINIARWSQHSCVEVEKIVES